VTAPALTIGWDDALAWRLERQLLSRPSPLDAADVVRQLAGAQAQVPSATELAIAVRRAAGTPGAVAAALADRTLIRTWAMRGTLHVLPAADAPAYLALVAAGRTWHRTPWQREFAPHQWLLRGASRRTDLRRWFAALDLAGRRPPRPRRRHLGAERRSPGRHAVPREPAAEGRPGRRGGADDTAAGRRRQPAAVVVITTT
jgi:hypothetical protein